MGPIKKKKYVEKLDEETVDDSLIANEIQATFEGRNLEDSDFHGIKQLLQQAFLKAYVDISQVTDILINQTGIGSVLKQAYEDEEEEIEDDDDDALNEVFGVTTMLNLNKHWETPCVQQIFCYLRQQAVKYGDGEVQKKLNDVISEKKRVGLLINERFLNIPSSISVPMLSSLQKEIERMSRKDLSYDLQYFIMICKTYKSKGETGDVSFSNDEESIFFAHADCSFEYSVLEESDTCIAGKWGSKEEQIIPFRKILFFSASKLESIISQITAFVQT